MIGEPRTVVANVLVIGSGAAGMRAAIAAHQAGAEVVVVGQAARASTRTPCSRRAGSTPRSAPATPRTRGSSTSPTRWREGYLLGDPRVVEIVVREAPAAVEELAEWGCGFARTDDGRIDQRFFGAHRWRRTCYAGDYSGRAILHTLAEQGRRSSASRSSTSTTSRTC